MRKRIFSILLCCVMLVGGVMPTTVFAEGGSTLADITGTGASDDPYLIYTAEGLKQFRNIVNGQDEQTQNTGAHAVLMDDIVLNDGTFDTGGTYTTGESGKAAETWTPIGTFNSDTDYNANRPYTGTFDGDGYTIKGLYVKDMQYAGLFGYAANATIKNVTVDGYISTSVNENRSGGIAGYLSGGSITGCFNYCTVNSTGGGIVGLIDKRCQITGCGNAGRVSGAKTGGVVGYACDNCDIQDCYNVGAVSASQNYAGGIAGHLEQASISNCYNVGSVTTSENTYIGGIVGIGKESKTISICYWLEGTAENAAGDDLQNKVSNSEVKNAAAFANGDVLALLKGGRIDSPWSKCGYLEAAGMIVPLLKGQTADSVDIIGAGTEEDPCQIYTAEGLKQFRDKVNSNDSICAKLMADIDLNNEMWTPIGSESNPYTGTFDGNGKTISGLNVTGVNAGLFASLSGGAVVKNLTVEGNIEASKTNGNAYAGGIAAQISGSAQNTSSVQITGCVNNATVKATVDNGENASYAAYAGGIVGHASGRVKITGCKNNGTVATDSNKASAYTGGIAGHTDGGVAIENCLNTAALSAATIREVILAYAHAYARAGGMIGYASDTTAVGCYNTGAVTTTTTGENPGQSHAGGIIGTVVATSVNVTYAITDCGNTGSITSTGEGINNYAGGIMSEAATPVEGSTLTVSGCYSTGTITAKDSIVAGGIAGSLNSLHGTLNISNCYWLKSICDKAVGQFSPDKPPTVTRTEAKTKAEFADGTVLNLLEEGSTDSSWGSTGYLNAADMTLPLLKWQTADSHYHNCEWKHTDTEHWKECACGLIESGSKDAHHLENGVCECGYTKPYSPTVQKPEITVIGSGKVTLSAYGSIANITADEGYELVSITVNGKEIANTDKLTGLKTGDKVVVTFQKKSEEPTVDTKTIADKVSKMKMTARSAKTTKKNIRITVKTDRETNNLIKEIKDLGYTVKYKYYRSTKKASKYTAKVEKDADINSYINTSGKKGTKYYYKVRVMVYDADGNLVAKSDLKQCSYAARTWSK